MDTETAAFHITNTGDQFGFAIVPSVIDQTSCGFVSMGMMIQIASC